MRMPSVVLAAMLAAITAAATMTTASPGEGIQPLSKIAIHKATVNLHKSAYVQVTSPALIGDQDEAIVTVTFGLHDPIQPSNDDWIGVFSPADFLKGVCDNPSRYRTEPLLCTAPIKFKYANESVPYVDSGKGTIRFVLINQRSDFSFVLFTGGLVKERKSTTA